MASSFSISESRPQPRSGFTLVELLVVIAIIGILVAMLLPAVNSAREAARRMQCKNNLKQDQLAMIGYHDIYKVYPPGRNGSDSRGQATSYGLSATVQILPFLEEKPLYDQMEKNLVNQVWSRAGGTTWGSFAGNLRLIAKVLPSFRCPSDPTGPTYTAKELQWDTGAPYDPPITAVLALASYAWNAGTVEDDNNGQYSGSINRSGYKYNNSGLFFQYDPTLNKRKFRGKDVVDGQSKTFFLGDAQIETSTFQLMLDSHTVWSFGQRFGSFRSALKPMNNVRSNWFPVGTSFECGGFGSNHAGGAQFAFGDGHVVWLSDTIDLRTYQAFSTRGPIVYTTGSPVPRMGGENVSEP